MSQTTIQTYREIGLVYLDSNGCNTNFLPVAHARGNPIPSEQGYLSLLSLLYHISILQFPTSIGKLNVILYHDVKKYDQVQVRVENKEMWAELQKRGEEIGKNCLFGGVKLKEVVERGNFTRCGIWNEKYAIKEISNDEVLSPWVNRIREGSKETFRKL